MKVFISYCQHNGGLSLAYKASSIIENVGRNRCWFYDRDKTPGADRYKEIRYRITEWCEFVLFLCTNGSANSLGQRDEIIFVREWRIPIIPIRIDDSAAPSILSRDSFTYQDIKEENFEQEFPSNRRLRQILDSQKTLEKNLIVKVKS
jgi:hypothetical protein